MATSETFGAWLRKRRTELGMTQQQLAGKMFVSIALVSYWENGRRTPDIAILSELATCLQVSDAELLDALRGGTEKPTVILVDDEGVNLAGAHRVLLEALPEAEISAFASAKEALAFAGEQSVDIAFLDIELRGGSGLELAQKLLSLNPRLNVIFLTSYREYALGAWELGGSGYILKPLTVERVQKELSTLRYPVRGLK